MVTSKNGAPICTGIGLDLIRKQIAERFEAARQDNSPTSPREAFSKPNVSKISGITLKLRQQAPSTEPKTQRPLSEIVAPVMKVAESQFKDVVARHTRYNETHFVHAPKESPAELFAACEKAVERLNLSQEKAQRHEIEEES
jgi:hypothetical protein